MKKRNLATSIKLWGLCLALGAAGAASAKTIELRDVGAIERYSITDVITLGPSFTDRVGVHAVAGSQIEPFGTTLDLSIFSFDLLGIDDDFSATLQHLGSSGFQTVATSFDGPISFDELLGPRPYGSGGSGLLGGLYRGAPQAAAVPEADVWVMVLVGFGVVLYQLRRKQRTLEQEPVAA
jgi:hypothetical protein